MSRATSAIVDWLMRHRAGNDDMAAAPGRRVTLRRPVATGPPAK